MAAKATPLGQRPDAEVQQVAAYLRVSTEHQTEANQRPDVDRLIAARFPRARLTLYTERRSAAKERPEYDRMLRDAKASKFEVLVVWAIDRLGRSMAGNLNDVLALDAADVRVVSCRESWLDMQGPFRTLLIAIFSWAAEQERGRIAERIIAGQKRVHELGGVLGRPAFGLERDRIPAAGVPRGIPKVVLDEAARPTLRRMAELLLERGSLHGAAMQLQAERALPPSPNGLWDHKSVKRALQNEDLRRLGVWSPELLANVDATLNSRRRTPRGAAAPAHLCSSFLACAICGGSLASRPSQKGHTSYFCGRFNQKGKAACAGIGYRAEWRVDRALIAVVRSAIDGDIKARAIRIIRQRLEARPHGASERDAVAHALSEAESEGAHLAKAIAKGGKLEAFLDAAEKNDHDKAQLRARLARIDAAPAPLDARRRIAEIDRRLSTLSETLSLGGLAARPAVEAVLQGLRLKATPVIIKGERRWKLSGKIPAGYVLTIDGAESSDFSPTLEAEDEFLELRVVA